MVRTPASAVTVKVVPTTDPNVTLGMSFTVFGLMIFFSLREKGAAFTGTTRRRVAVDYDDLWIITLMTRFGMNVTLAHPDGYGLIPSVVELAGKNAKKSGGSFQVVNSMEESFRDADVVYPKSWAAYSVMQRRTPLLQKGDRDGLKALEKKCLAQNAKHKHWHCDEAMMKRTHNGAALYMHCLPADISGVSCKQGEVADTVFEKMSALAAPAYPGIRPLFVSLAALPADRMAQGWRTIVDEFCKK